jgi:hypothetical protein
MAVMMSRHSRFAVPPETHFFCLDASFRRAGSDHKKMWGVWSASGKSRDQLVYGGRAHSRFFQGPATRKDLFEALMCTAAEAAGKRRWAEKSPDHLGELHKIFDCYPNARIIVLLRDGRDVVTSLAKVPWARGRTLYSMTKQWRKAYDAYAMAARRWPQRVMLVRFESLVADPTAELTAVMAFVGEAFEAEQIEPTWASGPIVEQEMDWKRKAAEGIDVTRAQAWRNELKPLELLKLELLLGPQLQEAGYQEASRGMVSGWRYFWHLKKILYDLGDLPLVSVFWRPVSALLTWRRKSLRGSRP